MWSNVCSLQKYADPDVFWVFRTAKEKWLPVLNNGVKKSGGVSKMMWAYFAVNFKGTCNRFIEDEGERSNKDAYVRILEFSLLDFLEELWGKGTKSIFMQDDAKVHTAKYTMSWSREK